MSLSVMKLYKRILEFDVGGRRKRKALKECAKSAHGESNISWLILNGYVPDTRFWVSMRHAAGRRLMKLDTEVVNRVIAGAGQTF